MPQKFLNLPSAVYRKGNDGLIAAGYTNKAST